MKLIPGKLYRVRAGYQFHLWKKDMQSLEPGQERLVYLLGHSLVMFVKTSTETYNFLLVFQDIVGWTCFHGYNASQIFEAVDYE